MYIVLLRCVYLDGTVRTILHVVRTVRYMYVGDTDNHKMRLNHNRLSSQSCIV